MILNYNFQSSAKAEIWDLTVCIAVNGEKILSHAVTLMGQCPMSDSSEIFSHSTISSIFKLFEPCLSYYVHTQTDRQRDRQTDKIYDYSHACMILRVPRECLI